MPMLGKAKGKKLSQVKGARRQDTELYHATLGGPDVQRHH